MTELHRVGRASRRLLVATAVALSACAPLARPPLTPAQAAPLASCADLAGRLAYAQTTFTVEPVAAGALGGAGKPIAAHCRVTGRMNERTSPVDGKRYAIGFEMRLPQAWNGRFFYQANGGVDGRVVTATGAVSAGPGLDSALAQGFAVISSDAGHSAAQNGS